MCRAERWFSDLLFSEIEGIRICFSANGRIMTAFLSPRSLCSTSPAPHRCSPERRGRVCVSAQPPCYPSHSSPRLSRPFAMGLGLVGGPGSGLGLAGGQIQGQARRQSPRVLSGGFLRARGMVALEAAIANITVGTPEFSP